MVLFLAPISASAQRSADFSGPNGGSVLMGYDSRVCGSTAPGGALRYNSSSSCLEFCDGTNWVCPSPSGVTSGCESVGDTCNDGTIFVGLSPDGQTKMYTTPADAPTLIAWNDGSTNYVDTAVVNCTDSTPGTASSCQTGEANTALLVGLSGSGSPAPYQAAEYCDGLSAHGHNDWYLPAQDELDVLYDNKNAGDLNGTFNESGLWPAGFYWSSSEHGSAQARFQRFDNGSQNFNLKEREHGVRCVRR